MCTRKKQSVNPSEIYVLGYPFHQGAICCLVIDLAVCTFWNAGICTSKMLDSIILSYPRLGVFVHVTCRSTLLCAQMRLTSTDFKMAALLLITCFQELSSPISTSTPCFQHEFKGKLLRCLSFGFSWHILKSWLLLKLSTPCFQH